MSLLHLLFDSTGTSFMAPFFSSLALVLFSFWSVFSLYYIFIIIIIITIIILTRALWPARAGAQAARADVFLRAARARAQAQNGNAGAGPLCGDGSRACQGRPGVYHWQASEQRAGGARSAHARPGRLRGRKVTLPLCLWLTLPSNRYPSRGL